MNHFFSVRLNALALKICPLSEARIDRFRTSVEKRVEFRQKQGNHLRANRTLMRAAKLVHERAVRAVHPKWVSQLRQTEFEFSELAKQELRSNYEHIAHHFVGTAEHQAGQGDFAAALHSIDKAIRIIQKTKAAAAAGQIEGLMVKKSDLHLIHAEQLAGHENFAAALSSINLALQAIRDSAAAGSVERLERLNARKARLLVQQAEALEPIAAVEHAVGKWEAAAEFYLEALRVHPSGPIEWLARAARAFAKAIEMQSNSVTANNRAREYCKKMDDATEKGAEPPNGPAPPAALAPIPELVSAKRIISNAALDKDRALSANGAPGASAFNGGSK